ncbi:MAG: ATP--guanido phosphotransferase [Lachnospiraceae bacterium]|nr:ATP--guanido phosphotransferase [Lachnospiraceae bacterium]
MKWYENTDGRNDVFAAGRVRLARNLKSCPFPNRMSPEEIKNLNGLLKSRLSDLGEADGTAYRYYAVNELPDKERKALWERRVINETLAGRKTSTGLYLSDDESMSLSFGGDDHIRIQCMSTDVNLDQLWNECRRMDDRVNSRFPYAFHEKYGYLTAFPTNMGTGLRVSVILHLPFLSMGKQFRKLITEVGRFGIRVKGMFGEGPENYGNLYEISNQKTLGQTEEEIISLVYRMASHLAANERKVRSLALRENRVVLTDEAYKSYGVLKYARQMSLKEAMTFLSQIRVGLCEGLLQTKEPLNVFGCMLERQPASLMVRRLGEISPEELNILRAETIRDSLPELVC